MYRKENFGSVVLFLFGVPFALFGLWTMGQVWQLATGQATPQPANTPFWYPLIFAVLFGGIGFGLMYLAVWSAKSYTKQLRLQAEHPAEPWLWREDWAQGRVKSRTRNNMIVVWVFAILWNLMTLPFTTMLTPGAVKQNGPIYVLWLLLAVGVVLLIYAIRQTIAYLEFGKTYFEMASVPGVIGRELKGMIEARFPHSPDHGVHLRISCVHKVTTGSGKSASTTENILWRDEADLNPGLLCAGPMGTTIPVAFRIPVDAHPTEKISTRDEYLWLLEALADVPGVNYHDVFEVPLFRTSASPTEAEIASEEANGSARFATAVCGPVARPDHLTIEVRQNAEGTEFYFPPARNTKLAASTTAFTMIFSGVTYFLERAHAPIIFPVVFGFFSAVLIYLTLRQWLGTTRVVIGNSLKVQAGMLGGGSVREIALSDIALIEDKITTQQGTGTGTPYYDIILKLRDGRSVTLGCTLASKRETEWLMSEMQRLAGLKPSAAGAAAAAF